MKNEMIGIVGGLGPFAGLDLASKIFAQTKAQSDQEHLSVALLSFPKEIEDRTSFLLGQSSTNPAHAIFSVMEELERIGAGIVGIPCHTAHAPKIFDVIVEKQKEADSQLQLLNMIDEVRKYFLETHPNIKNVGVLSTTGTYKTKIYEAIFKDHDIDVILTDDRVQDMVHDAIYHSEYGIKAQSHPVTETAKMKLMEGMEYLQDKGAEAIILGCTEISYAMTRENLGWTNIIDPTRILARAMIIEANESKLKP